jgi:DNA-directed RNA polymerase subunit RPC12/RpoP
MPDDAAFCSKCGTPVSNASSASDTQSKNSAPQRAVIAPQGATSIKCPNCGAPIAPKFGEMVITCEYCGSGITLGNQGWSSIQKQSMLPLKFPSKDDIIVKTKLLMDQGFLHRHLQESSTLEEENLTYIPYWIVSVSARTSIITVDAASQIGQTATTAALFGIIAGGMGGGFGGGGRGGGFGRRIANIRTGSVFRGFMPGHIMMFGMGMGGGGMRRTQEMDSNYSYPIIALKALTEYQPKEYQFALGERAIFDVSKIPKGIKVLNGDISEDVARAQAKTLVDQLQSQKAHEKYHMIQQIHTDMDVSDGELMYVPVWFVRYDHKGNKIAVVIDGNSGLVINSIGLSKD